MGAPSLAATIKLTHKEYGPTVSASLKEAYKGTQIHFYAFANDADDTGLWSYGSETTKTKYKIQDNRLNYYLATILEDQEVRQVHLGPEAKG
jgi:hypothetical protein